MSSHRSSTSSSPIEMRIMPRVFGQMDDTELKAVWTYLRTLPAVPKGVR